MIDILTTIAKCPLPKLVKAENKSIKRILACVLRNDILPKIFLGFAYKYFYTENMSIQNKIYHRLSVVIGLFTTFICA